MVDHGAFMDWCPHCVKGRGESYPHRRTFQESGVPIISMDYMYLGIDLGQEESPEEGQGSAPILVMKDGNTGMVFAGVVIRKGREAYAIKKVAKDIKSLGYRRIVLRNDGEASIEALKEAVRMELDIDIIPENSPVGDHAANGVAEATVKQVQGQIRTMKDALETRIGARIEADSWILPWLILHAAATMNRRRKDRSGITAFRKWKGREFNRYVAEFGERVLYLKADSVGKDKLESRWGMTSGWESGMRAASRS